MKFFFSLIFILLMIPHLEAEVRHQKRPIISEWNEENLAPFDELILSWNGSRPIEGKFHFYVRVKLEEWSPWLHYATWGTDGQSSFKHTFDKVTVYQDTLNIAEKKATGFQVKIETEGARLDPLYALHVYTDGDKEDSHYIPSSSIALKVPGLSQMSLHHPRHADLCSPTSTTAALRYLSKQPLDPIDFAEHVWDSGFDIFGNWVFNVAEASTHLGPGWNCWVERLNSFQDIYKSLKQGIPVIVSVRGPLAGSAQAYSKGHLLAIIGYDAMTQRVICMDPAFPTDGETHVSYPLSDFMEAWGRRGNIAYVFRKGL